ncbi:MAG TPA: NfeD family protein [Parvularculaceae bacterium]|nr:NfeD family protein [Parvularculaceae bacterium]HNS85836.1 NfeD family protein [Parvularculaceae bacterium]
MVEFLATMPFWYWFVFAVILLIVEISTGTTYFLWPAAAAVVVGFADIWPLDGAWRMQFVIFAVVTFLLTIFATPKVKPWLHKSQADHLTLNERGAQKIGKRVKVEEAFSAGEGRVRYGDSVWLAASENGANFDKGAEVEIIGVDGAKLFVKAV